MLRPSAVALAALLLVGCSGDDSGPSDPIALDGGEGADADAPDAGGDVGTTEPEAGAVDGSVAEPGTWQVGGAGTVTFSVVDGRLRLDDLSPADGWQVTEQDVDDDEIDIELERGDEVYTFEVELEDDGTRLEVHLEHDLEGASPGTVELGAAGSVTVSVADDRLVVDDLTVTDGWEVTEREEDDEKLELELVRGDARWRVTIERDGDRIDLERDFEVRGGL